MAEQSLKLLPMDSINSSVASGNKRFFDLSPGEPDKLRGTSLQKCYGRKITSQLKALPNRNNAPF
ncbi:MAG: hypothetical protein NTZ16_13045 [Verrucomicrobia bacterium]|nr:hypothetical protein [Verrucomicrobiota bacterium]